MNLYLLQHGEAVDKETDPERPLTQKGRDDTVKVAAYSAKHAAMSVLAVTHSGKLRARQTAELFALEIEALQGVVPVKDLEPDANPAIWAERLGLMEDDVVLVGHLPHLSRLASLLTCGDPDKEVIEFRNSGLICLKKQSPTKFAISWTMLPETCED
jgi:phosphohistidine phosphatase